MNQYVTVNERLYPARKRSGKSGVQVKLTVGRNIITGRQIQHDYTGRDASEVQQRIDASRSLSDEQLQLLPENPMIEELFERYVKAKSLVVSQGTIENISLYFRKRIQPWFGGRNVRSIRSEEIRAWQEELKAAGRCAGYIIESYQLMKDILEYGRRKAYLQTNVCHYARMVHFKTEKQEILNENQLESLLADRKEHPYYGYYAVTLLLGLRCAESLALSWNQIDWDRKTVQIRQQATKDGKIIPWTKTGRNRTLRMPETAILLLKREHRMQERLAAQNPGWDNPARLIFTDTKGGMLSYNTVQCSFAELMKNTDGPKVSLHSLRRTTASVLAENASMHAAQYYLGHVSSSSTLTYIYPNEKDQRHLADTVGNYYAKLMKDLNREGEAT